MWWKIYFWISAIVACLNVFAVVKMLLEWHLSGVGPILATIVYALAVYSYAFKKHIFSQQAWKTWLVIVLLTHVLRWSALWPLNNNFDIVTIVIIIFFGIIFPLPAWYCVYRLGFDKNERVKVAADKISKKRTAKKGYEISSK